MHHLFFTVCWNIGGSVFFNLKLIFNPEHLENTVNTLVNISMTTKNPRNILKKQNQSRAKMILMVRSTFSGKVFNLQNSFFNTFKAKNTKKNQS